MRAKMRLIFKIVTLFMLSIFIAGCFGGGGGGGGGAAAPANPPANVNATWDNANWDNANWEP